MLQLFLLLAACAEPKPDDIRYLFSLTNGTGATLTTATVCYDDGAENQCLDFEPMLADGATDEIQWAPTTVLADPTVTASVSAIDDADRSYLTDSETFTGAAMDPESGLTVPVLDVPFTLTEADQAR